MKQERNVIMHGASGNFMDQIVFRNRAGKTVLCAPPLLDEDREPTTEQLAIQEKFREAVRYAKGAVKNEAIKAAYAAKAERGQSAYNIAFADYFSIPKVNTIDTTAYQGAIGNKITVVATDEFKVAAVQVAIYTMDNELVEQGAAVFNEEDQEWIYTAKEDHIALEGSTIKATAKDLPGNEGSLEVTL